MSLLTPIWLWALGALVIPIAIHLLSRKEGKTIHIGSIRFLAETSTSKFSSIRLNEILLLAIRSLLIILIVIFLAGLILSFTSSDKSSPWVLVEKGLEENDNIKKLTDSLKKNGYEIRRLSEGFSAIEADTTHHAPDYYKLIENLSAVQNSQTLVIASNALPNFKGKRIPLPENVTWIPYPVQQTAFPVTLQPADTVSITLAFNKVFEYDKKILKAAIQSIQSSAPAPIIVHEIQASNSQELLITDWLIWLSDSKLMHEGKCLQIDLTHFNTVLSQKDKNHWLLTERLNEENAVAQHLPVQLMQMLFDQRAYSGKQDVRTLPDKLAWSNTLEHGILNDIKTKQPAGKALILIIAMLFICERIVSFYRRQ